MGLLDLFRREQKGRDLAERDAPADLGAVHNDTDDEHVGRVGSDDSADTGETGAERRAEQD